MYFMVKFQTYIARPYKNQFFSPFRVGYIKKSEIIPADYRRLINLTVDEHTQNFKSDTAVPISN